MLICCPIVTQYTFFSAHTQHSQGRTYVRAQNKSLQVQEIILTIFSDHSGIKQENQ